MLTGERAMYLSRPASSNSAIASAVNIPPMKLAPLALQTAPNFSHSMSSARSKREPIAGLGASSAPSGSGNPGNEPPLRMR